MAFGFVSLLKLPAMASFRTSQVVLVVKNPPANAGDVRDLGSIPGLGRASGGGHDNPLQYSSLENPMERKAWQATVHEISKSRTWLKQLSTCTNGQVFCCYFLPYYPKREGFTLSAKVVHMSVCVNSLSCRGCDRLPHSWLGPRLTSLSQLCSRQPRVLVRGSCPGSILQLLSLCVFIFLDNSPVPL